MNHSRPERIELSGDGLRGRRGRMFARSPGAGFHAADNVLEIYDEIGPDAVSTSSVAATLKAMPGDVTVRINSPGGSCDMGIGIYNLLIGHRGAVNVEIVGVAASAASLIAMSGDSIKISANGFLMIHEVWGLTVGNAGDHTKQADTLSRFDKSLAQTYARRTGQSVATISRMMADETWIAAPDAVRLGFANKILESSSASARANFDLSVYQNVPASLASIAAPIRAAKIQSRADLERLLRDKLEIPNGAARKIAAGGFSALNGNDEQTKIDELAESVAAATVEIRL